VTVGEWCHHGVFDVTRYHYYKGSSILAGSRSMTMPPDFTNIIGNLRDAPVMNLFVLVGFMLVVLAAVGRRWKLDVGGRVLSGVCGVGLLGAATAMFLGVANARANTPKDLTLAHRGKTGASNAEIALAPAPAPPPAAFEAETHSAVATKSAPKIAMKAAAAPKATQHLPSPPPAVVPAETAVRPTKTLPPRDVYGDWGCEETKTISASLVLPDGADFLSATVDAVNVDKAKSFQRLPPSFDPATRTVTGAVEFRGLDRVFFNCPGGGHATVRLTVTAAVRAGAS
jgi:hypothetical protein